MWAIVGRIFSFLPGFLRSRLGSWIAAALAWLGLTWATTSFVVTPSLDALTSYMSSIGSTAGTLGTVALQWVGKMRFDQAVTMWAGAIATKKGVEAGKAFFMRRGS